jgi:hypothetical protein
MGSGSRPGHGSGFAIGLNGFQNVYVLTTNHVHLLLTSDDADGVSRTMQYLARRYVPHIK